MRHLRLIKSIEPTGLCDCCGSEDAVLMYPSGFDLTSVGWGRNCMENGAEPVWAIREFMRTRPEEAQDEWFLEGVTVYQNGEYIKARDWLAAGGQTSIHADVPHKADVALGERAESN